MPYQSLGECLKDMFITEAEIIDRYVGNQLWGWGTNSSGQIGDGTAVDRSSPVQTVSGGTNWKQVSVSSSHRAAIKTDGTLWLWGCGSSGALGTNSTTHRSSPVQTVSGGTDWRVVAVAGTASSDANNHTIAIKTDGTLWSWGEASAGQMGNNSVVDRSSPVQTISAGNNWKEISAALCRSAAIKTDGTLWLWGNNLGGPIGDNSITARSSPVQTVSGGTNWKQVSLGQCHTGAIKTDGTLWMWGDNTSGILADNSVVNKSSPVQTVSGGTNWKNVGLGTCFSAAIKTDGTLWLWGTGNNGAMGNNSSVDRSSPVQTVSGGTNWKQIGLNSADCSSISAIKTDGTLWSWGANDTGSIGNNTASTIRYSSPVQTISGTNWKQVARGGRGNAGAITYTES
jgi:alpha-tubulin suppressor-like RCC1 family protein